MRILDIITERALSPRDFYELKRLDVLIDRLDQGKPFIDNNTEEPIIVVPTQKELDHLKNIQQIFLGKTSVTAAQITKVMPSTIGGVKLSTLFKDGGFGGRGGDKGNAKDPSNDDEKSNKGNIGPAVEMWKAIALFTKLTHRKNEPVTIEDLITTKDSIAPSMQKIRKKNEKGVVATSPTAVVRSTKSVPDYNQKVSDTISIVIDVGLGSFQRAVEASPDDKPLWGRIGGILKFVNENNALGRYNKIFASNGRVDPISIAVVGGEGGKADVRSSYIDPVTNKSKPLSSLTFSVKAGSNKVSQSSGSTIEGVKTMFKMLGLNDAHADSAITASGYVPKSRGDKNETEQQIQGRYRAIVEIFKMAQVELTKELAAASDDGERKFLNNLFYQIKHGITGGENMFMVDFNANSTYKKFNPHSVSNLVNVVDLEAKLGSGTRPTIDIYDRNSNANLIKLRLEAQTNGRLTLHVELEPKFKDLATKAPKTTPVNPAAPATAPVAGIAPSTPAPVTQLPASIQNLNKPDGSKTPMGAAPVNAASAGPQT